MNFKNETFNYLKKFLTDSRLQKIEKFAVESSDFVLPVMEDIFQFRNAAAIVRSAEACGFHNIVALEKKHVFDPDWKVTKGAENWVGVEKLPYDLETLKTIKNRGYKMLAVSAEKEATSLADFNISEPVSLIFGTEQEGVTEEILNFADETLAIPMYGFTQSFNVSVAAALCFYDLRQKLEKSNLDYKLNDEQQLDLKIRWAVNSLQSGEEILQKFLSENS